MLDDNLPLRPVQVGLAQIAWPLVRLHRPRDAHVGQRLRQASSDEGEAEPGLRGRITAGSDLIHRPTQLPGTTAREPLRCVREIDARGVGLGATLELRARPPHQMIADGHERVLTQCPGQIEVCPDPRGDPYSGVAAEQGRLHREEAPPQECRLPTPYAGSRQMDTGVHPVPARSEHGSTRPMPGRPDRLDDVLGQGAGQRELPESSSREPGGEDRGVLAAVRGDDIQLGEREVTARPQPTGHGAQI